MMGVISCVMRRGCGGSRHPEEALALHFPPQHNLEDFDSASEESEPGSPSSHVRHCAKGTAAGIFLALLCVPFLWLCLPLLGGVQDLFAVQVARPKESPFFRQKVLVSSPTTGAPVQQVPMQQVPMQQAPPSTTIAPTLSAVSTHSPEQVLPPTVSPSSPQMVAAQMARTPRRPADEPALSTTPQDPDEGGSCTNQEELFGGLCYKKCSLLTNGKDPIRTSPWTCCRSHPCALNQNVSLGSHVACTGYDVAEHGGCPHRPGTCLQDEEMLLGICYKKCGLLTDKAFPYRVAPATCCKESGLSCLDFMNDYTSKEFAVGGGAAQLDACGSSGELWLGVCYKKCSQLTGNAYPHRVAPATCCKAQNRLPHRGTDGVWHLGCLDFRQDKTRLEFSTPLGQKENKAHAPLKSPAHEHLIGIQQ